MSLTVKRTNSWLHLSFIRTCLSKCCIVFLFEPTLIPITFKFKHAAKEWSFWPSLIRLQFITSKPQGWSINPPAWFVSCIVFHYLLFPWLLPRLQRLTR